MNNATRTALRAASVLGLSAVASFAAAQATDWKQIVKPPLPAFQSATPLRIVLPNGMVVFLQEDKALPLIRGIALVRGGWRDEPADKAGLVSILGQTWRTSGTATKTGDQLDDYLEARGARVETSGAIDSLQVSFDTLKDSFDDVFSVFADVLRNPDFKDDKLALAKNQMNTGVARRNDDVSQIAGRVARFQGYGKDSPVARVPEYATIAAVTKADLAAFHRARVIPNNVIMSFSGDFDAKALEGKVRGAFGSWTKGAAPAPFRLPAYEPKPGVYFVQRDDVTQSQIRMVHAGIQRMNPDYYAVTVMNEILGGGFSARLFSNVRSKKGLAYSVGGGVGAGLDFPGLFTLSTSTKSGTTAAAIDALFEEMDGMKKNPPTAEELKLAKDAIFNSFIFRIDTRRKTLIERVNNEFYGLPLNLLDQYIPGIQKVTLADVNAAVAKYLHRDRVAIVVAGKGQDFDRPLSSFGTVTNVDITIPEATKPAAPGGAPAAPMSAGAAAEARALFAKAVEALGGEARLKTVKAVREKSTIVAKTPMGDQTIDAESILVFPDRARQTLNTPGGAMVTVVTPEAAFASMGTMGVRDLPASQRESQSRSLRLNAISIATRAHDPALGLSLAAEVTKIGDADTRALTITDGAAEMKWFVDVKTGRILRTSQRAAAGEQVMDLSDYRTIDGVAIAFRRKGTAGPQELDVTVNEFLVNPPVDPKAFEKPAGN